MKHEMQTTRNQAVLLTAVVVLTLGLAQIASAAKPPPPPPADARYTAEWIAMAGYGINDAGQIAGERGNNACLLTPADCDGDGDLEWFWGEDHDVNLLIEDLGTLSPGERSRAVALNELGQVVGVSGGDGSTQAFIWDAANGMVGLGTLGGAKSEAKAINDAGQVVGVAQNSDGVDRAFVIEADENGVWFRDDDHDGINDLMIDLGTLGGAASEARAINDLGQIVGWAQNSAGVDRAFVLEADDNGVWFREVNGDDVNALMVDLGTLGGAESAALDINDLGQIVGWAQDGKGKGHPFLYADGAMSSLETLLPEGSASCLNNATQILGTSTKARGGWRWTGASTISIQTFWEDGVPTPFSELIDTDLGRWGGYDINDSGQFVNYWVMHPLP